MKLLTYSTHDQLHRAAAQQIIDQVHMKSNSVLGLATGGTPLGMYAELVKAYQNKEVSFHQVTSFNLDEYIGLPEDHPQSYRSYMKKHLFDHVNFEQKRIHLPDGNASDPLRECERYEDAIRLAGSIDLQILGLGHNGHIGFNEPNVSLNSRTHVVQLSEQTRQANARFFSSYDEVPTQAITMGVGTILKARQLLLMVKGSDKADIINKALTGPITTTIPASLLQTHPNLFVMMDEPAAYHFHINQEGYK